MKAGYGTFFDYRRRCVTAIIDCLYKKTVVWPDENERKEIAKRMHEGFGFPGCVGVVDGTLFNLAFCPQTEDFSDYHGRKGKFTMTCMVVNDDQKMIRYFHAGWPGVVHDDRVMFNSKLCRKADEHFCPT